MNIISSGFSGRCLSYVMPLILFGILMVNLQLNKDANKTPGDFQIETKVKGKIFPSNWYDEPVKVRAIGLKEEHKANSVEQIESIAEKYPKHVLKENLETVYLLSDLQMYGNQAGSVNSDRNLYICIPTCEHYRKSVVEQHFHSRLNRILKRNYRDRFDQDKWTAINPSGFKYGEDQVINAGDTELKTGDFKNGFVCKYAKHNMDADFAMVSAHLLCGNSKLWSLAKRYPRIEQKIERVIAFYQSLDPKMDKEYFKQLALKSATYCH